MKNARKKVVLVLLTVMLMILCTMQASAKVHGRYFKVSCKSTTQAKVVGSKKKVTIKAGTKMIAFSRGNMVTVKMKNGTRAKVKRSKLHYIGLKTTKKSFSKEALESYVNRKGYSSKTKYLILVSQYTLHTAIFKGSKRNWKLVRNMICVVGKGTSDATTSAGVFKLCRRDSAYGMPRVYFTWNNAKQWGNSFHRRVSSAKQEAASHGCVRLGDSDLAYLVKHCPMGTTVVSF